MAIEAGLLRERITVQRSAESRNRLGESILEWATFLDTWASVQGVSAREYFLAGHQRSEISHKIRTRYITGLTSKMRILWRGRTLEIISILEQDNRRVHELICLETL